MKRLFITLLLFVTSLGLCQVNNPGQGATTAEVQTLLNVPTADGAANGDVSDVVGNKTDTTAGNSVIAISKQIVLDTGTTIPATITVIDGFHDVPGADVTTNAIMSQVIGNKTDAANDTADEASLIGLSRELLADVALIGTDETIRHIPKFGGEIWYVDGTGGNDSNTGTKPDDAFLTIGQAFTDMAAGDAVNVKAATYTETGLDLGTGDTKDFVELWCEIGVVIDPATGTGLTVSGDYCKVLGQVVITPSAANTGLLVSGSFGYFQDVTASAGDINFEISGTGNSFVRCIGSIPSDSSFSIQANSQILKECSTAGIGTATNGYKINNSADYCVLRSCTSIGHGTAGYNIITGSVSCTILDCSSGAGDGRWVDIDHASVWSNFTFENHINKEIDIAQSGADTYEYNLFKVTGTVKIKEITGFVETVLTGSNTACYLQVYSANGSEVITKATGVTIGAALVGSFVGRVDDDGEALAFHDADAPGMIDSVDASNQSFRVIEDRTGAAHVATYIRFIHTTDGASTGEIDWYIMWEPISDDGFLEPV